MSMHHARKGGCVTKNTKKTSSSNQEVGLSWAYSPYSPCTVYECRRKRPQNNPICFTSLERCITTLSDECIACITQPLPCNLQGREQVNGKGTAHNESLRFKPSYFDETAVAGTHKPFVLNLWKEGESDGVHRESTTTRECFQ